MARSGGSGKVWRQRQGLEVMVKRDEVLLPPVYPAPAQHPPLARYPPLVRYPPLARHPPPARHLPSSLCRVLLYMLTVPSRCLPSSRVAPRRVPSTCVPSTCALLRRVLVKAGAGSLQAARSGGSGKV